MGRKLLGAHSFTHLPPPPLQLHPNKSSCILSLVIYIYSSLRQQLHASKLLSLTTYTNCVVVGGICPPQTVTVSSLDQPGWQLWWRSQTWLSSKQKAKLNLKMVPWIHALGTTWQVHSTMDDQWPLCDQQHWGSPCWFHLFQFYTGIFRE